MTITELGTLATVERRFDGPYPADLVLAGGQYCRLLLHEAEAACRFHAMRANRSLTAARWHWALAQLGLEPMHLARALVADARAERRRAYAWRRRAGRLGTASVRDMG
jgi:hypothetical protein